MRNRTAKIAVDLTKEVWGIKSFTIDGFGLEGCSGWYIPDHKILLMYEIGRDQDFIDYCLKRAGSIACGFRRLEGVLRDLHNRWDGRTDEITMADMFKEGWVKFKSVEGRVLIASEGVGKDIVAELVAALLPYAEHRIVVRMDGDVTKIDNPKPEQLFGMVEE